MKPILIVTHSGNFHADEMFAVACLKLVLSDREIKIIRSRDSKIIETADYVVDVGGVHDVLSNRFDHHQSGGAGERQHNIFYSSFGLVWKNFGVKAILSVLKKHNIEMSEQLVKECFERIDSLLVAPIDAVDVGVDVYKGVFEDFGPYIIQNALASFRPYLGENKTDDQGFFEALSFVESILSREILHVTSVILAKSELEKIYFDTEDKKIIVVDKHFPRMVFQEVYSKFEEPIFVVYQGDSEGTFWRVLAIRDGGQGFKNRKNLPGSWAGKTGIELAEASGVPDAIFCHNSGFLCTAKSRNGALELAQKAILG